MFKNKLLTFIVSLILLVGGVLLLNAVSPNDQNNIWSTGTSAIGITLTTDGDLVGNTSNILDLGTSTYEWKDGHFDGTLTTDVLTVDESATIGTTLVVTGDVTGNADIRCDLFLGIGSPYTVTVATTITIASTASNLHLISADNSGVITMTAQPVFSTTTASAGDYLLVTTTQTIATFVLDAGTSEDLRLGSGTRTIGQFDSLLLIFVNDEWQEVSFINN